MNRAALINEGFTPTIPADWDAVLRTMGTNDFVRCDLISKLEDDGGLELLVHFRLGKMATCYIGLE